VCGSAAFDTEPQRPGNNVPSGTTLLDSPTPADERTRRIKRWDRFRKQLAAVQIAASAFGMVTLLDSVGQARGDATLLIATMLAVLALTCLGGILLLRDRTGGVPLSLCYYALQVVLFHVDSARLWIVLGPYALLILGAGGPTASVGFGYGFANVVGVGRAPNWIGVNLFALAAFWFLWRRPWRELHAASTAHELSRVDNASLTGATGE
jgi:hypothetical protein